MSNTAPRRPWMCRRVVLAAAAALSMTACGSPTPPAEERAEPVSTVEGIETLTPESTDDEVMRHMIWALDTQTVSTELSTHFPDLDRARAYDIQRLRLQHQEQTEALVGWKIGWSNQTDPRVGIDPVFGHIMESNVLEPGEPVATTKFINGQAGVEAEVAFWLNADLPGPTVTRDDVIAATGEVAGVIELLAPRVAPGPDGVLSHNHGIADNVFHIGVIFGSNRVGLDEVDLSAETVSVEINGEVAAAGRMATTLGRDPIEAVAWIANELITYGYHLHAGDFVITGTVAGAPQVGAGDTARLVYSSLGTVEMAVAREPDPSDD